MLKANRRENAKGGYDINKAKTREFLSFLKFINDES